jgi:hypothetical protein
MELQETGSNYTTDKFEKRIQELHDLISKVDTSNNQGMAQKERLEQLIKVNAKLYRYFLGAEIQ